MKHLRPLVLAGALVAAAAGANAQTADDTVRLSGLIKINRAEGPAGAPKKASSGTSISLRGGAMVTPRGAGLIGVDFYLQDVNFSGGWDGRIDVDFIIKANFRGSNTAVPVTFDLLHYEASGAGGHNVYYGGGLGIMFGDGSVLDGKLILGTELSNKIGAELNVHFNDRDTLLTLLARLHL